jgi:exodeoxyribonuclease VII large subunit
LPFPLLPKRIAIISVKTSKGFSDFMSILGKNQWGYAYSCYLFPALLQGDKAVDSILGQLKFIRGMKEHFDVAVILRGGGGDVGLNCYDNYNLAREVACFPIPVLTGIGHSTNETVVEMVSGRNLITPTDVAYFLIQLYHNFSVKLQELAGKVTDFALGMIDEEKRRRGDIGRELMEGSVRFIEEGKRRQGDLGRELVLATRLLLDREKRRQGDLGKKVLHWGELIIKDQEYKVKNQKLLLNHIARQMLTKQGLRISQAEHQVRLLDPRNVLKRGYSITYAGGKPLRDIDRVDVGEEITTQLFEGIIKSEIKSKSK